ncbi:MAG: DUF2169 domain-containing protein [Minicystis sp.]
MDVVSACPLRVASIVWQPRAGAWAITVVCKATFALLPGVSPLAEEQEDIFEADAHWDDDPRRSLAAASDLAPFRRRAEVILVGHAHAPDRIPVATLLARLVVGDVDKSIRVVGDRLFSLDGQLSEPARFTRMPLGWERAGGGPDTTNPAGIRADGRPDARGRTPLPNLFPPGAHVAERGAFVEPIGFGPIAPTWPSRVAKLHHRAAGWDHRRWNERPLPADIDGGYFNAAPADQQLDEIRADERIVLENLHPEHARLVTSLAPVAPMATVTGAPRANGSLQLVRDTLWIDADRGICTLTFRGALAIDHPAQAGRVEITLPSAEWDVEETIDRGEPPPSSRPPVIRAGAGLPLVLGSGMLAQQDPPQIREEAAPPSEPTLARVIEAAAPVLPFRGGSWPVEDPDTADMTAGELRMIEEHATFDGDGVPGRPVLPFVGAPLAPAAPPSPPAGAWVPPALPFFPVAAAPVPQVEMRPPIPQAETRPLIPQAETLVLIPQVETRPPIPRAETRPPQLTVPLVESAPAPPPMVGPLATPEMYVASVPAPEAPAVEPAAPEQPTAVAEKPAEDALPLDAFPLERCAAIAAAIAHRKADKATILDRHQLSSPVWQSLEDHWSTALRAESDRGRTTLRRLYDEAYVTELERLRGPLRVEDYAALVVAAERSQSARALADRDLPSGAMMRIQRVWLTKIADDPALAASVRAAVEDARDA